MVGAARRTSISRKFSGGPYSSSKDCDRASGSDCIVGLERAVVDGGVEELRERVDVMEAGLEAVARDWLVHVLAPASTLTFDGDG
jgi:hypothetical protein